MILRSPYKINIFYVLVVTLMMTACGVLEGNDIVDNTDQIATAITNKEVDYTNQGRIYLIGINGFIQVVGRKDISKISINAERKVGSDNMDDAQKELERLQVDIQDTSGVVIIKTVQPEDTRGRLYEVDYVLSVPDSVTFIVNAVNGNISIKDIADTVSVQHVGGEVELSNLSGSTYVSLVSGTLISNLTLPVNGEIIEQMITGTMDLRIPTTTSAQFEAYNYSGTISLSNIALQNPTQTNFSLSGTFGAGLGTIVLSINGGTINVTGY